MNLGRIAVAASVLALAACQPHHHQQPSPSATEQPGAPPVQSEAERTREMEQRAAEATQKLQEAQQQGVTGEQAEDAYKQFQEEQRKLQQQAEGNPQQQ